MQELKASFEKNQQQVNLNNPFGKCNSRVKTMYQFSKRVTLYKDGKKMKNSGMIAYAWFVWERNYVGKPSIEWIL